MPTGSEALPQRCDGRDENDDVLAEPPAVVDGARAGVAGRHLEVEVLDTLRREGLHRGVDSAAATPPRRASGTT